MSGPYNLTLIRWFYFILSVLTSSIAIFRFSHLCFPYLLQLFPFRFRYWCSFTGLALRVLSILQEFCQCSLRHTILPVSLPHRPSKSEHLRCWAQPMLTSQPFIFVTDWEQAAAHSDFLLIHHSAAWSESKLWLPRLCFVPWKVREKYKCVSLYGQL